MSSHTDLRRTLGVMLTVIVILGVGVIAAVTAYQIVFPCPDFTDSQSGDSADATWILFPPGPRCDMYVNLGYGVRGVHTDWPSAARVLALICWLGWIGTLFWMRRRLGSSDSTAGDSPDAADQVRAKASESDVRSA